MRLSGARIHERRTTIPLFHLNCQILKPCFYLRHNPASITNEQHNCTVQQSRGHFSFRKGNRRVSLRRCSATSSIAWSSDQARTVASSAVVPHNIGPSRKRYTSPPFFFSWHLRRLEPTANTSNGTNTQPTPIVMYSIAVVLESDYCTVYCPHVMA